MSATTENRDGSGAVLIDEIRELRAQLDESDRALGIVARDVDQLRAVVANLPPCPEFPTSDLLTSAWSGPARVGFMVYPTADLLESEVEDFIASLEADGGVVKAVQFEMNPDQGYGACVIYRLPAPATEATQ